MPVVAGYNSTVESELLGAKCVSLNAQIHWRGLPRRPKCNERRPSPVRVQSVHSVAQLSRLAPRALHIESNCLVSALQNSNRVPKVLSQLATLFLFFVFLFLFFSLCLFFCSFFFFFLLLCLLHKFAQLQRASNFAFARVCLHHSHHLPTRTLLSLYSYSVCKQ